MGLMSIAFVDKRVKYYMSLVAALDPSVEVHFLDETSNGLTQIAETLVDRTGIDAIHII